jgi:FkbM family methyltransferase
MSIAEQYSANVPLIFPSQNLLKTWIRADPHQLFHCRYTEKHHRYPTSLKPALDDDKWIDFWVPLADFYHWPHITYFNSINELPDLLKRIDVQKISQLMAEENLNRTQKVDSYWHSVLLKPMQMLKTIKLHSPLCTYTQPQFLKHISSNSSTKNINTIVEVGSRDLLDAICLAQQFPLATVHSYECLPSSVDLCKRAHKQLPSYVQKRIHFYPVALGAEDGKLDLYPFSDPTNPGAASFYRRHDQKEDYKQKIDVPVKRLLIAADLLCLDVQGHELEILKGCDMTKIKFIIMAEPNGTFPNFTRVHIGAPSKHDIQTFMTKQKFQEICRLRENDHEDNVLYQQMN